MPKNKKKKNSRLEKFEILLRLGEGAELPVLVFDDDEKLFFWGLLAREIN